MEPFVWPATVDPQPCSLCGQNVEPGDAFYFFTDSDGKVKQVHAACEQKLWGA